MRLFEIISPPLYLCTAAKHTKGEVVEQLPIFPLGVEREGKLEHRRPDDAIPREKSFYLQTSPCDAPYVYLVVPIGRVDRYHTSWLKLIDETLLANVGEMDSYATGYWSGKPWPEDQDAPIEIRASKVKVLKRVDGWEL